jgi:hypothetical protein
MEPLRRVTLADQAENALREAVRDGRFGDRLPGMRPLARALGINALTMAEAVSRLVADGTVETDGPRKRFRIVRGSRSGKARSGIRKLLFLTSEPMHETKPVALEILSNLLLERPEWEIRHRVSGRDDGRPDQRYWNGLLKSEEAGHLLVFSGRPPLANWAVKRGIPTYFLGGDPGGAPVPVIGVDTALMVRRVLERLIVLGHKRICMPICGMPETFRERQRSEFERCLAEHGLPFVPNYNVPFVSQQDPDELARVLERVFRARPPTALLLIEWEHFIMASCVLRDRGLRIPKDVSVALLSHERNMHWHQPLIAHYQYPVAQVAKTLRRWIEKPPTDLHVKLSLPLELVEGSSLARARSD